MTVGGGYGPAQRGGRDATVVTIGEVEVGGRLDAPSVRVVEHYRWTGEPHHALTPSLVELLRRTWRCRRVVVDATGLGTGVASGLVKAMGGAVEPFVFTAGSKSRLGFELLGAVNTGSGERVLGGWVFGVRGVLARDGAGAGSVSGEPDDGLLCGGVSGARRLSDEPGADGACGGKPGSHRSREGGGDSPILTFPRGGKGSGGSSWWGPLTRDGLTRGYDDCLMSLAVMVPAGASPPRTARGRVDDASSLGW